MRILTVEIGSDGKPIYKDKSVDSISQFCTKNRGLLDSKCKDFYIDLFNNSNSKNPVQCPYGLFATTPVTWVEKSRIFSAFVDTNKTINLPLEIREAPQYADVILLTEFVGEAVKESADYEYDHLEAAIHDVRHFNSDIGSHAENLLKIAGYHPQDEWNLDSINSDTTLKPILSIFCASRELSLALTLHELTRDPSQATNEEIIQHNIHGIFHRQRKISEEYLRKKNLTINIGQTRKLMNLTKSFGLIPKILLDNAIKYAARNSRISINFTETQHFFRIEVLNSGPAVRENEIEELFCKRRRGSNRSGVDGRGMGLWLASMIIEANKGTIQMDVVEASKDLANRRIGTTKIVIQLLRQG